MEDGGNGPRTYELVGEVKELRDQLNKRGNEVQRRLTDVETQMRTIRAVGSLIGSVIVGVVTLLVIHVLL